jgi:DNA-binding HxlR family transcriptional regulator/putative sterol carrier protein
MYDYGEACPVSRAAAVLCERWTLQIIREMMLGATRFSEFQKYLPKISPSLLNARLKLLTEQEIIVRRRIPEKRGYEYQLAPAGKALVPVISEIGKWGMQWVYDGLTEERMNMVVLLREIAVFLKTDQLPAGDTVLQFTFTDLEAGQKQYIVLHDGKREVCDENPGHEVDVYLRSTLRTLAEIWWGDTGLLAAIDDGRLKLGGSAAHTQRIRQWFPVSAFARDNPRFAD